MLLTILVAVAILGFLILIHEVGHFVAARIFGMRVEEFGFGFPPRLWGKKKGDTLYSINAIPLGGFVQIAGENNQDDTDPKTRINPNAPNTKNEKKIIEKELSYTIAGILFNVQKELGRFARERQYGDLFEKKLKEKNIPYEREKAFLVADRKSNFADFVIDGRIIVDLKAKPFVTKEDYAQMLRYLKIASLELGLIANLRDKYLKPKRVLNADFKPIVSGNEFSGHSGIFGVSDRFNEKPIWQRAVVLCAGVAMNFLVGWLVLMPVLMTGTPESVVITGVRDNTPAAVAGIKEGDVIVGFANGEEFGAFVAEHKGEEIVLTINRNGQEIAVYATPRIDAPEGEGALGVEYVAGSIEKMGMGQAMKESLRYAWTIFSFVFVTIGRLLASVFTGEPIFSQLSGPVGVYKATAQAVGLGWVYVANVMALISLNLAALNIFPFPALDGGRLLFLAIEKIRGKAVSSAIQGWVNGTAFIMLILFIVAITVKDIATLF